MEESEKIFPEMERIHFLTNQSYCKNPNQCFILNDFGFKIPLKEFIVYCVGIINGERVVHCIRILKKKTSDKIGTIQIQWFDPSHKTNEYTLFWVNSNVYLKKFFFQFEDKLNFFKSSFIYYARLDQYIRLSSLLNYIYLDEENPIGIIIYKSPTIYYHHKNKIIFPSDKLNMKRNKEIKKSLILFKKKYTIDKYFRQNFPNLFYEIDHILTNQKIV